MDIFLVSYLLLSNHGKRFVLEPSSTLAASVNLTVQYIDRAFLICDLDNQDT